MSNKDLNSARKNPKDEFYTQLTDIEKELRYYKEKFRGKTILCNCDDPYESNFFKYFAMNFNHLGLKKIIATSYQGSPVLGSQLPIFESEAPEVSNKRAYKFEVTETPDLNGDGAVDLADVELLLQSQGNVMTKLNGNGDFRSNEVVALLEEADIVATNPPFSLFDEFLPMLIEHKKEFIILGNINGLGTNSVFPFIMSGNAWLGPSISSGDRVFEVPSYYPLDAAGCWEESDGRRYIRVKGVRWITNLDHVKRHEELALFKTYEPSLYPEFDNYHAINVNKVKEIPVDYMGPMGVPITFLDKHNPDQFEILDANDYRKDHQPRKTSMLIKDASGAVGGINKYVRVLIRRRKP